MGNACSSCTLDAGAYGDAPCGQHSARTGSIAAISGSAAAVFGALAAWFHAHAIFCALGCGVMQATGEPLVGRAGGRCRGGVAWRRGGGGVRRVANGGCDGARCVEQPVP